MTHVPSPQSALASHVRSWTQYLPKCEFAFGGVVPTECFWSLVGKELLLQNDQGKP